MVSGCAAEVTRTLEEVEGLREGMEADDMNLTALLREIEQGSTEAVALEKSVDAARLERDDASKQVEQHQGAFEQLTDRIAVRRQV